MKRISLISRIRLRAAITYLVLPCLAVLITLGVTTDLFNTHKVAQAVNITSGDSIPAGNYDKDIVINNTTIYMDYQAVYQSGANIGEACSSVSDENCDTKRRFKSLTLKNGAVLTHTQASARDTSVTLEASDSSSIDKWRKVEIELTGNLILESGSTIDVDGQGYPGGVYAHKDGSGNSFNPYALQLGDEITVKLIISNLSTSQTSTITDEFLTLPDKSIKCKFLSALNNGSGGRPQPDDSKVVWSMVSLTGEEEVSYICKVQK